MSRSLTPKNDERSAATSATRSVGSSIARRTARVSCTSWRSKKDLPPSTVKRRPAASSASSSAPHLGEPPRQHQHVAGAARPRRRRVTGSRTDSRPARDVGEEGGERPPPRPRAGPRRSRSAGRREAQGHDRRLVGEAGRRRDRLVGRLVGLVRGLDELGEDAVHEAQDRGPRAEVLDRGAARRALAALRASRASSRKRRTSARRKR